MFKKCLQTVVLAAWLATPYMVSAALIDELPMIKKLHVHYHINGVYDGVDAVTGDVFFRFSGPIHAAPAIDATGTIGTTPGPVIGQITNWRLRFHLAPGNDGQLTNLDTLVSCDPCELRMNDGAVLTAMLEGSEAWLSGINVPMQVQLLPELDGVPTDDAQHPMHLRAISCVGLQEVVGRGYLANTKGALCVNGTFNFPFEPSTSGDLASGTLTGESNATLTMH